MTELKMVPDEQGGNTGLVANNFQGYTDIWCHDLDIRVPYV